MTIVGKYTCSFYYNSGEVCGKTCMHPEGCSFHWKSKRRVSCIECGKSTGSISERCPLYIRGYYVIQYYHRLHAKASANENKI